ncbi:MAG TPA: hypothetical protein VII63_08505 [Caulobacteraceae bacterium]
MSLSPRDVIKRAARLHGAIASGDDPTADEMVDALIALNTMKRAMFGTVIGTRLSAQDATGSTMQAENGGLYQIPAALFTLTAPSKPRGGSRFGVADPNLNFATNNCTIARNGRLVEGLAANLVLSVAGTSRNWWFRPDTGNWTRETDYVTPDDTIEFPDGLIAYLPYLLAVAFAAEYGADLRQDVIAGAAEGREAFVKAYGRHGRNQLDPPIGSAPQAQPQPQAR